MLHLAPLTPQLWGELESQSPPKLGDLGGEQDLCVHRTLKRGVRGVVQDLIYKTLTRFQIKLNAGTQICHKDVQSNRLAA